jgi:hypothetical protein
MSAAAMPIQPPATTALAPQPTMANNEQQNSLMLQVSSQERRIAELTSSLDERNNQLQKFQTEKKEEMQALLAGMKSWLSNLDIKSETHRKEFDDGLDRLVNQSAFDNGIDPHPISYLCFQGNIMGSHIPQKSENKYPKSITNAYTHKFQSVLRNPKTNTEIHHQCLHT